MKKLYFLICIIFIFSVFCSGCDQSPAESSSSSFSSEAVLSPEESVHEKLLAFSSFSSYDAAITVELNETEFVSEGTLFPTETGYVYQTEQEILFFDETIEVRYDSESFKIILTVRDFEFSFDTVAVDSSDVEYLFVKRSEIEMHERYLTAKHDRTAQTQNLLTEFINHRESTLSELFFAVLGTESDDLIDLFESAIDENTQMWEIEHLIEGIDEEYHLSSTLLYAALAYALSVDAQQLYSYVSANPDATLSTALSDLGSPLTYPELFPHVRSVFATPCNEIFGDDVYTQAASLSVTELRTKLICEYTEYYTSGLTAIVYFDYTYQTERYYGNVTVDLSPNL